MSVTGILGRFSALLATVMFVVALLYWYNYLALGGGVTAIYAALWGMLLGIVFLTATGIMRWV